MERARARPTTASMTMNPSYQQQTRDLIDGLKAACASNGLGNDGNEYNEERGQVHFLKLGKSS